MRERKRHPFLPLFILYTRSSRGDKVPVPPTVKFLPSFVERYKFAEFEESFPRPVVEPKAWMLVLTLTFFYSDRDIFYGVKSK